MTFILTFLPLQGERQDREGKPPRAATARLKKRRLSEAANARINGMETEREKTEAVPTEKPKEGKEGGKREGGGERSFPVFEGTGKPHIVDG